MAELMTYHDVQKFLDRHVIQYMVEGEGYFTPLEMCYHIKTFVNDWITHEMARGILRSLTDRGFCRYKRGLFTEDGEVAGAGYGLTQKGAGVLQGTLPTNRKCIERTI